MNLNILIIVVTVVALGGGFLGWWMDNGQKKDTTENTEVSAENLNGTTILFNSCAFLYNNFNILYFCSLKRAGNSNVDNCSFNFAISSNFLAFSSLVILSQPHIFFNSIRYNAIHTFKIFCTFSTLTSAF